MHCLKLAFLVLTAACLPVLSVTAAQDDESALRADKIALKAGRIITVLDEEIENGVILIDRGKIVEVGKDVEIPYDYWVMDMSDKVVFPGMVEAHTTRGIDRTNESLPVVPFLSVYDAIDPSNLAFEDALRDGITTLLISQGNNTVIGGMSRVVRPIGRTVDEMTLKAEAGLKLSASPMYGQDRLTQMAILRETFRELEEYLGDLAESAYEKDLEKKGETIKLGPAAAREKGAALISDKDLDFRHKNLKRLADGRLAAYVYCGAAMDVYNAVAFAEEHGFLKRTVFVLGSECYKAVDLIKSTGRPVILEPSMIHRETDPLTGDETEVFVPLAFFEAGISFAVTTEPRDVYGLRYPWYQAARLMRNGIPRETAIKAITITPASIIGMGTRLGALMPGYDATLLVLTGDPLESGTWVDKVMIGGRMVYEQEKDYRLKELLTGQEQPVEPAPQGDQEEKAAEAEAAPGQAESASEANKDAGKSQEKAPPSGQ